MSASEFYKKYQQQNSASLSYPSGAAASSYYAGPHVPVPGPSSHSVPTLANAYEYDVGIMAQQTAYVPGALVDKRGGAGGNIPKGGKRKTVLRSDGRQTYEDQTLLEWDPCEFHCFVLMMCCDVLTLCTCVRL